MKIIDLLNKIAKGEKVPKKIIVTNSVGRKYEFIYHIIDKNYYIEDMPTSTYSIYDFIDYYHGDYILNREIEIPEEIKEE